jgi:hypothetical protein
MLNKNKESTHACLVSNTRGCWTLVAEIRMITVQSQPQANSSGNSILKKPVTKEKKTGRVTQAVREPA